MKLLVAGLPYVGARVVQCYQLEEFVTYSVKEIYYTLQGEGANTGRPAVFCRFAGCNLWTGREEDRHKAICWFCDTDFVGIDGQGGGKFNTPRDLAAAVTSLWPMHTSQGDKRFVVCTGGEPLLQLDEALVNALHAQNFEIAIETNGTCSVPEGVDWICVSPKSGTDLLLRSGNELKLVYPQEKVSPENFEGMDFQRFYLVPMDGPSRERNTQLAMRYCMEHPNWRLNLQIHKLLGIF